MLEAKRGERIILSEWADRYCKKCYGRGFIGMFADGKPQICKCVERNYRAGRKQVTIQEPKKDVRSMVLGDLTVKHEDGTEE
jgi:hypothetical protein